MDTAGKKVFFLSEIVLILFSAIGVGYLLIVERQLEKRYGIEPAVVVTPAETNQQVVTGEVPEGSNVIIENGRIIGVTPASNPPPPAENNDQPQQPANPPDGSSGTQSVGPAPADIQSEAGSRSTRE